jgi:hypothetical protein
MNVVQIKEPLDTKLTDSLDFDDLTSMEIACLKLLKSGTYDVDSMSDRMFDTLFKLEVDELVYNHKVTASGEKAINLAFELGGSKERRRAASLKDVDVDKIFEENKPDTWSSMDEY